jgi:hypothetical protein
VNSGDAPYHGQVLEWLLNGDPAIRWQVMRDLAHGPAGRWEREQRRVGREGWGARLLAHQDRTGRWTPRFYGRKWISTTYSLLLLRDMGLSPDDLRVRRSCLLILDEGVGPDGGIVPSRSFGRSEECISGFVLRLLSWFLIIDERREQLLDYLLGRQMRDGGWNCQTCRGATHGSFHTTINVLEGLRDYVDSGGPRRREAEAAEARGREFFLRHRLYRSHHTGAIAKSSFTLFSFPPRWYHDVLRTLDYFRAARHGYDGRLEDPIALVLKKQRAGGTWLLQNRHPGRTYFEMEQVGRPSRWNTLRALRVLQWWDDVRHEVSRTGIDDRSGRSPQARL